MTLAKNSHTCFSWEQLVYAPNLSTDLLDNEPESVVHPNTQTGSHHLTTLPPHCAIWTTFITYIPVEKNVLSPDIFPLTKLALLADRWTMFSHLIVGRDMCFWRLHHETRCGHPSCSQQMPQHIVKSATGGSHLKRSGGSLGPAARGQKIFGIDGVEHWL